MRQDLRITLDLIRHGETDRNKLPLIGQSPEEPLNDTGKEQAQKLAQSLEKKGIIYDRVYTSSYLRARETAEIVCAKMPKNTSFATVSQLREIFQGDGLNKSRQEVYSKEGEIDRINFLGMAFSFPNGESLFDVQFRAVSFLQQELLDNPHMRNDKELRIAFFSHGITIKCLIHYILNFDHRMTWRMNIDNTSISSFTLKDGQWFVNCINNISHL